MTRVLLAPDKFKGTLTAAEVAGHLADGIRSAAPGTGIVTVPVSDGGDGLLAAFTAAGFAPVTVAGGGAGPPGLTGTVAYARRGAAAVGADLVVTGEGALDEQTLRGKAPAAVAEAARTAGVPVVAVAGRCLLAPDRLRDAGFGAVYVLQDEAGAPGEALAAPGPLLRRIGARLMEKGLR